MNTNIFERGACLRGATRASFLGWNSWGTVLLVCAGFAGCTTKTETPVAPIDRDKKTTSPNETNVTVAPPVEIKPDPVREWSLRLEQAQQQFEKGDLDAAQGAVNELQSRANDLSLDLPQYEALAKLAGQEKGDTAHLRIELRPPLFSPHEL